MKFKEGDYIDVGHNGILEVICADKEKAVCLKIQRNYNGNGFYTGKAVVISNDEEKYKNKNWKMDTQVKIEGKYRWAPLEIEEIIKLPN